MYINSVVQLWASSKIVYIVFADILRLYILYCVVHPLLRVYILSIPGQSLKLLAGMPKFYK